MIALVRRFLLGWLLLLASLAQAASLEVSGEGQRAGAAFEYLLDRGGMLSLADAMAAKDYRPMGDGGLYLGFRDEVLWTRVTLHNPTGAALDRYLALEHPRLERVSLFLLKQGAWRRLENGLSVEVSQRPLRSRVIAFPLRLEAGASLTLYLRVESRTRLSLLPVLWSPQGFERAVAREDTVNALSLGALLGLSLYAILSFPFQRDRAILYQGISMVFGCIGQAGLRGYDLALGWWSDPEYLLRATLAASVLAVMFLNRMVADLIPLADYGWRRVRQLLLGLLLLQGMSLAAVATGAVAVFPVLFPLAQASKIAFLGVCLAAWRRGFMPAGMVSVALLLSLLTGLLVFVDFRALWPFPHVDIHLVTAVLPVVVSLFFFMGIGQRLDVLQRDKLAAQAETLAVQREAAVRLEALVRERTGQLQEAKDLAERANRAKGEFLARVSHELRTPLQLILGFAQVLQRELSGKSRHHLALLEEGGRHLARLVDDLLDFTRSQRGGLVLEPRSARLSEVLGRLHEYGQALVQPPDLHFVSQFDDDLPAVLEMDTQRLEQVLLILLSNAVHHGGRGQVTLSVQTLASDDKACMLRFSVDDEGSGITAADLARIFEAFEQVAETQHKKGLGLGLAIGRQIVQAMGGELQVESQVGKGSRFWFDVSFARADLSEVFHPESGSDTSHNGGMSRTVLVVEDERGSRSLLEKILGDAGFEVCATAGVEEGVAQLADKTFDLALLDQNLPDGTAWDILSSLREQGNFMPVVMLSAQSPNPPADWGGRPGFDAVLLKPVSGDVILSCIADLVEKSKPGASTGEHDPMTSDGMSEATRPSMADCQELARLAGQGAIYEIEAWIKGIQAGHPQCGAFCNEVEDCLSRLDFKGILALLPP